MPPLSGESVACSLLNSPFPFLSGRPLFAVNSTLLSYLIPALASEFNMSAPVEIAPAAVAAEAPKVTEEVAKEEAPATTEATTTETPVAPDATTEATPEVNTTEPTAAALEATTETTEAPATTVTETAPAEAAPESPKPKSPGLFSKLLAPFKGEKKLKAPKSPKKEKKREEVEPAAAPAGEEAPKPEEPVAAKEETPVADVTPEAPEEPATTEAVVESTPEPVVAVAAPEEPVKITETPADENNLAPAPEAPKVEEKKTTEAAPAPTEETKPEASTTPAPQFLLPVCNAPLLDWTFECLASAGVDEVFVFCVAHVDQIKEAIENSQWSKPSSGMSITTILSREARSVGDAMRELDAKQILTSDFVLLTGDVVSNVRLDEVIKEHKERRKVSKDAIMTCVVKEVGKAHRSKPVSEKNIFVLDAHTNECVYYEYQQANPPKQKVSFLREIFDKHPDVDVRTDLMDCSIDICSVDVPVLFTENFDYQDLRKDFMHGVLTSDILGKTMHCHIARGGYAARVRDTRSYASVSKDIISRWSFPLVPDNNHPAQHDYDYRAGNKYIAKRADLSRNSRIGKNTMIGPSTRIEDDAFITNSVLGAGCEIGSGSTISGSYLFDHVHVGAGCDIVDSIIATRVKLERGVKLAKGCIIARGVVLGEGTILPPFSRVSSAKPEDVEEWEGREAVELGPGSHAWVWPNDKYRQSVEAESEDEEEEETFANARLGRLADTCSDIETYESDQASTQASESESDISPPISPTSSTSDLPGLPSLDAASDFQSECTQSLKRAFDEEHTVDNAAIELKTLRMASNVPLPQVREAVIAFIIQKLSDEGAGRPELKKMFGRWGGLLKQIGGYDEAETLLQFQRACCKTPERSRLFPAVLTELYQNELIEEDGLTDWFMDPQSKGANSRLNSDFHASYDQLRVIGGQLLQQLRAQDSESEETDENDE
ncbi:hypothetical protein RSAG8_00286, partial [Rhizoctonia solani AG-8 WAC10335]